MKEHGLDVQKLTVTGDAGRRAVQAVRTPLGQASTCIGERDASRPGRFFWLAGLLAFICSRRLSPACSSWVRRIGQRRLAALHVAVAVSVASASVAALMIVLGGMPLGYFLARSIRAVAVLGFLVQLPLALPPLTSGVLLLFLLGPKPVGRLTGGALTDSFAGIVLAEMFVAAPFLIIAAKSAFRPSTRYSKTSPPRSAAARSRFFRVVPAGRVAGHPRGTGACVAARVRRIRRDGDGRLSPVFAAGLYLRRVRRPGAAGDDAVAAADLARHCRHGLQPRLLYSRRRASRRCCMDSGDAAAQPTRRAARCRERRDRRSRLPAETPSRRFRSRHCVGAATRRLAIIGPSGSGKSLTLSLIAGLERDERGSCACVDGRDLGALAARAPSDRLYAAGLRPVSAYDGGEQLAFPVDADATSARYWLERLGLAARTSATAA